MKATLDIINQMQAEGVIGEYAIGGAVGATFYLALGSDGFFRQVMISREKRLNRLYLRMWTEFRYELCRPSIL